MIVAKSPWTPSKEFADRFKERRRLIAPFVRRFGGPAIVHATRNARTFEAILKEGKLMTPSDHGQPIACPYLSRDLGIDDVVYFSLGFVYATAYGCKYNFLFDTGFLKDLTYYKGGVSYLCYRNAVRYLYEHDRRSLERLAKQSAECRSVLEKFYKEPYKGEVLRQLDFWRIEEPLYRFLKTHPQKSEIMTIITSTANGLLAAYPASCRHAMRNYLTDAVPELLSTRTIDLTHNRHFIGVYISGAIPRTTLALLKRRYPEKLLFDGRRFRKIATIRQ